MIIILLADGFEEIEALTPLDMLRRADLPVVTVSVTREKAVTGAHGITVLADRTADEVNPATADHLILPGGMPGTLHLDASPVTDAYLEAVMRKGGRIAAICAAPLILGRRELLRGKQAVCFPGFESELVGAQVLDRSHPFVTDGNITTAWGMDVALPFAKELVRLLSQKPTNGEETPGEEGDTPRTTGPDATESTQSAPDYANYKVPPVTLLEEPADESDGESAEECQRISDLLTKTLMSFDVKATIKGAARGPRVTRYEAVPASGVKASQITALLDNISLALMTNNIRMEVPIPGKSAIGIEVPNRHPTPVSLRKLIESAEFLNSESRTLAAIGEDVTGNPVFFDIAKAPHLLMAGATGMGKSVCMNSILISMLFKARPDELKLIIIDPKNVEFSAYKGIPHLLIPVVSDAMKAVGALAWAVQEMERRYDEILKLTVRNLDGYNEKVSKDPTLGKPIPKIVIVIDELSDLIEQARNPVENLIRCIAQKARAAGIHLIIGTQRPTVHVITGTIKANIPSRICCKVSSSVDSRTILEQGGAEKLLDKGDMLFAPANSPAPLRVQGAFVSDGEVEEVMNFLKSQSGGNSYDNSVLEEIDRATQKYISFCACENHDGEEESIEDYYRNEKFLEAVDVVIQTGRASTSLIQRRIGVGYGRAAKYIDIMEDLGVVGEPDGQRPRRVLVTMDEWKERLAQDDAD